MANLPESPEIKLARIEERLIGLQDDIHGYQDMVKDSLNGLGRLVRSHQKEIEKIKRDRWWIGALFGIAMSLLLAWLGHK